MTSIATFALGVGAVACSDSSTSEAEGRTTTTAPPTTAVPEGDAFYEAPTDLTGGEPGELFRSAPFAPDEFGVDAAGSRILYRSTGAAEEPIAVSGAVFVPAGEAPDGGWPLLAWAHGTTGVADRCAPSRSEDMFGYDGYLGDLVADGFVVVATDYEGLGTAGPHPYLDKAAEARGVIDSMRAARTLLDEQGVATADGWAVLGHSQGGQAAIATAELATAATAADDPLVGVVSIAPASQLEMLPDFLAGSPYQGYLAFAAAGILATDDSVSAEDLMGPTALDRFDTLDTGCWTEVMSAFADVPAADLDTPTPAGASAIEDFLRRNEPGTEPLGVPVLLVQGADDDTVPQAATELLHTTLCDADEVAALRVYPDVGHDEVLDPSRPDVVAWVTDRLAGTAAPGCG